MASQLTATLGTIHYVRRLMQAFKSFDSDKDGSITPAELSRLMRSLGYDLSYQEVREMMQRGDKDGDGLLTVDEFLNINTNEMQVSRLITQRETGLGDYRYGGRRYFGRRYP